MDNEQKPSWLHRLGGILFFGFFTAVCFFMLYLDLSEMVHQLASRSALVEVNFHLAALFGASIGLLCFIVIFCIPNNRKSKGIQRLISALQTGIVVSLVATLAGPLVAYPTARLVMPQLGYTYCEHAGSPHFQRFRPLYFTTTAQACYGEWLGYQK